MRLHKEAQDQLEDFWILACSISQRPTCIAELVPTATNYSGACDAALAGQGGVWFPPSTPSATTPDHPPIVWRWPHPECIQKQLVSFANPTGTISNSDLELAGTIAHQDVLVNAVDCAEKTLAIGCDNTPAVAWRKKGSVTTPGPASYLLREAALHQRQHRYKTNIFHIPGILNTLADIASRRFDLSDRDLLTYLDLIAPQRQPWQLHQLAPSTISRLTCALQRRRNSNPSLGTETTTETPCGTSAGSPTLPSLVLTPSSRIVPTESNTSKCLQYDCGMVPLPEIASRSSLTPFEMPSFKWQRRSPYWGGQIRASTCTGE